MVSIKKNFLYSSVITVSNYFFPLLTFPYVSRVLGVSNIGICNFIDSIINYFIYISMMGIVVTGIREIAANKENNERLSGIFTSLITINIFSTIIAVLALVVCMYTVPELFEYKDLLFIGVCKLIGNMLMIDWLYRGLEDFKYITKRTLLVKCIYVICIFIFIQTPCDYKVYYLISMLMVTVNAIFNITYSRKFVHIDFYHLQIKKYLAPFFTMGFYIIITSMYTSFNVVYLGFVTDTTQVGYYTTSYKLYTIIIAVLGSFTGVMLPRMTAMLANGNVEGFKNMIGKSFDTLFAFAIPVVIMSIIFTPEIILLLSGNGFQGAEIPARIIMPLILIIGCEQILVIQILMPMKQDKIIFRNAFAGAVIGVLMNILLVKDLGAIGSGIVWVLSEITVFCVAQHSVRRIANIKFPFKRLFINIGYFIPAIIICLVIYFLCKTNAFLRLSIAGGFVFTYTILIQIKFLKNETIIQIIKHRIIK